MLNLVSLIALSTVFLGTVAFAADSQLNETGMSVPPGFENARQMDRFVVLKEKLKRAVCDESFVSKAPTLESVTEENSEESEYTLNISAEIPEYELLSFLLGDNLAGLNSDHVANQIKLALRQHNLEASLQQSSISSEQFLEAQSTIASVKRRTSLDVCEGLVSPNKLRDLVNANPSRFLEASRGHAAPTSSGYLIEALDRQNRFGVVQDRRGEKLTSKYLVPGWLEPFEVERVVVMRGKPQRVYRRVSNPVTNSTQSVEVMSPQEVPLGVLFPSREPAASDWSVYRNWAELSETRLQQVEAYRQQIEFEAIRVLQGSFGRKASVIAKVRDLQEFYKNLIHAYQVFPNEKQFDTYAKAAAKKSRALEEITQNILGNDFLEAVRQARVNGNYVQFGLFKPDPKLHAIYAEYLSRLSRIKTTASTSAVWDSSR